MGKLFNTTTIVSVMVAMAIYGLIVAPMLVAKANGDAAKRRR